MESTQRGHDIIIRDFNCIKTLRSEVTAHSSTSSCAYPHINMRTYVSGCVRADAYNLILNFARIIMLPGPGPGPGPVLCIYQCFPQHHNNRALRQV